MPDSETVLFFEVGSPASIMVEFLIGDDGLKGLRKSFEAGEGSGCFLGISGGISSGNDGLVGGKFSAGSGVLIAGTITIGCAPET